MCNYQRVIPRDLFNESKLLKGLGRLVLLIHDGQCPLKFEHDGQAFVIAQNQDCGSLYCSNLAFWSPCGSLIHIQSIYNDKSPYTLTTIWNDEEIQVFNDDGSFTDEFEAIWKADRYVTEFIDLNHDPDTQTRYVIQPNRLNMNWETIGPNEYHCKESRLES